MVWETDSSSVKKLHFSDGSSIEVNEFTADSIKNAAANKGYRRFTVSTDSEGINELGSSDSLSGYNDLYISPKEKVA